MTKCGKMSIIHLYDSLLKKYPKDITKTILRYYFEKKKYYTLLFSPSCNKDCNNIPLIYCSSDRTEVIKYLGKFTKFKDIEKYNIDNVERYGFKMDSRNYAIDHTIPDNGSININGRGKDLIYATTHINEFTQILEDKLVSLGLLDMKSERRTTSGLKGLKSKRHTTSGLKSKRHTTSGLKSIKDNIEYDPDNSEFENTADDGYIEFTILNSDLGDNVLRIFLELDKVNNVKGVYNRYQFPINNYSELFGEFAFICIDRCRINEPTFWLFEDIKIPNIKKKQEMITRTII